MRCREIFERYEQADMTEQNNPHDMRWRKFPEEKPEKTGYYECVSNETTDLFVTICFFDVVFDPSCNDEISKWWFASRTDQASVTHWRGGPLP